MESETTKQSPRGMLSASTDEAEALAEYRSVSLLALVGFVMGLASPLVFLADLLLALPLFGAAISGLALVKIRASDGQLVGRSLALIGLVLSVVSVGAMKSHSGSVGYLLSRQARPAAEQWIGHVVAGELEKAFSLTSASERAKTPSPKGPPGMPTEPPFEAFVNKGVVQSLLLLGENANAKFVKNIACNRLPDRNRVLQLYHVTPGSPVTRDTGTDGPVEVRIALEQSARGEQPAAWRIDSYDRPPE